MSLKLRIKFHYQPYIPTEKDEVAPGEYQRVHNNFSGVDLVCEVINADGEVLGTLPTLQAAQIGRLGVDEITADVTLTFLCFDHPFIDGGIVIG
jgi:hypothetical protein